MTLFTPDPFRTVLVALKKWDFGSSVTLKRNDGVTAREAFGHGSRFSWEPVAMDKLTASVRTTVDAAVDKVFTSWVSPDSLAAWFWPFPAAFDVDLSVGGTFHYSSTALGVAGRFLEIDAPHRLVFTWIWDGECDETLVSVEFRSVADSTEILLRHTGNADETTRDDQRDKPLRPVSSRSIGLRSGSTVHSASHRIPAPGAMASNSSRRAENSVRCPDGHDSRFTQPLEQRK